MQAVFSSERCCCCLQVQALQQAGQRFDPFGFCQLGSKKIVKLYFRNE